MRWSSRRPWSENISRLTLHDVKASELNIPTINVNPWDTQETLITLPFTILLEDEKVSLRSKNKLEYFMEIKGFVDVSLVDWDGRVSSVIFLPRCNLRCPYCYNSTLVLHPEKLPMVPFKEIGDYLKQHRDWIDGVVITGGEPTVHRDLPNLCSKIKRMGFLVKLDTNGTNPSMVRTLIERGVVDYVALDVKAPLKEEKYSAASGVDTKILLGKIRETVETLLDFRVEYEFRTTLVPTLHKKADVEEICKEIRGCQKYVIQNFKGGVETLNPNFKELKPFTDGEMKAFLTLARKFVSNTVLRGAPHPSS